MEPVTVPFPFEPDDSVSLTELTRKARPALDPPLVKWWVRARVAVAIAMLTPVGIAAALSPLYAAPGTWVAFAFNSLGQTYRGSASALSCK